MATSPFEVGSKVRLTHTFLRNTAQYAGHDAHATWTVVACSCGLCKTGRFVSTNQPVADPEMYADAPVSERPAGRHFNVANLERAK